MSAAAAAAAKSLQSCPTLCDPVDGSLLGSSVPGILQARILEWVAISFSMNNHYLPIKEIGNSPSGDYPEANPSYAVAGVSVTSVFPLTSPPRREV